LEYFEEFSIGSVSFINFKLENATILYSKPFYTIKTNENMNENKENNENNKDESNDKPALLKAIEIILADPSVIKKEALSLKSKYQDKYQSSKSEDQINEMIIDKIISNYSYYTAFVGAGTALTGIIPGLGTAIAMFGGATADAAMSMKYQIEMTMAIATICGHNIETEEARRIALIVAGLGTVNEGIKEGGKQISSKAFVKMTQQYLKGATLQAVKEIFKKVGITFTRKALEKAIPFGIGVVIGFSANKGLTYYVGTKAKSFFLLKDE